MFWFTSASARSAFCVVVHLFGNWWWLLGVLWSSRLPTRSQTRTYVVPNQELDQREVVTHSPDVQPRVAVALLHGAVRVQQLVAQEDLGNERMKVGVLVCFI